MRLLLAVLLAAAMAAAQPAPRAGSFDELSRQAQQAYESGRSTEAVALFQRALRLRPQWAQGWWALGSTQYQAGRPRECRDALQHMVRLDPSAAPGFLVLGLCEFDLKLYDAAFNDFKRGHTLVPEGRGGQLLDLADYHLALLLIRQGAFERSQDFLVKVAWHVKEDPEKMFACGLAALRMAILPEEVPASDRDVVMLAGRAFWNLATKPPDQAEAAFAALLEKYPNFANVHYFYGTYTAVHKTSECAHQFREELRVNPSSVPARVQLALQYLDEGKAEEALTLAREAVGLSPSSVGSQLALGRALTASGDDRGALAAFLAAKRLDGESAQIRLFLTGAYRALGRVEEMHREQAEYDRLKAAASRWP